MNWTVVISAGALIVFLGVALLISRATTRIVEIYQSSREDGDEWQGKE